MKITISNDVANRYMKIIKDSVERLAADIKVETDLNKLEIKDKLYSFKPGLKECTIEFNDDYLLDIGEVGIRYFPMIFGLIRSIYDLASVAGNDINALTQFYKMHDDEEAEEDQ